MPFTEETETCMEDVSLHDFYKAFGLVDYPFNLYTAENEVSYKGKLFVHPINYDTIKSSFEGHRSIIIQGNRGTGKTALITDLIHGVDKQDQLLCVIDDYAELNIKPTTDEYYLLLIKNLVATLFDRLFIDKTRIKSLSKDDKIFLSVLLSQYTDPLTKKELKRKIESIQLSPIKRFIKRNTNFIRAFLNYGLTAALNIVNDVIRCYFSVLPPIDSSKAREIIPSFSIEAETEFNKQNSSYRLLIKICTLICMLNYTKVTVFFDKFDEDSRIDNDADVVSEFIKPLLTDNKLLESPEIQIVISVWKIPFDRISGSVRTQKHYCPELLWNRTALTKVLNQRIAVFSNGQVKDYRKFFDDSIDIETYTRIFELSNGNPRDLWHVLNYIFQEQFNLDPSLNKISSAAISSGLKTFVTKFNFYEYYPKKNNARANSMDIYSYIKHLLKLPDYKFTKSQLSDMALTGGSTNNYVVSMENLGLVVKTEEKVSGGVVYKINDPKVIYAIRNNLDISKT